MATVGRYISEMADEAAGRWAAPRWVAPVSLLVAVVGSLAMMALRLWGAGFERVTAEDSILEWMQFAAFAAGAGASAVAAIRLRRRPLMALLWAAFAAALVFVAGEEISWGQRLLGIETPAQFAARNRQNETTLHNLEGILDYFNLAVLVASVVGLVAPIVLRRRPAVRAALDPLVPPLFVGPLFAVTAAYRLVRTFALTESRFTLVKYGEWAELCFAVALAAFALLIARRSRYL